METRPSILMKGVQEGSEGGRGREEVWEKAEESRRTKGPTPHDRRFNSGTPSSPVQERTTRWITQDYYLIIVMLLLELRRNEVPSDYDLLGFCSLENVS